MTRHISRFFENRLRIVQQISSETLKSEKLNQLWQKLRELLSRNKHTIVFDMLQELRTLRQIYFQTESPEEQKRIVEIQQELITKLQAYANRILQTARNPRLSKTKRDKLMELYGELMDQIAINISYLEEGIAAGTDIQQQALEILESYFKQNPPATQIARYGFLCFTITELV